MRDDLVYRAAGPFTFQVNLESGWPDAPDPGDNTWKVLEHTTQPDLEQLQLDINNKYTSEGKKRVIIDFYTRIIIPKHNMTVESEGNLIKFLVVPNEPQIQPAEIYDITTQLVPEWGFFVNAQSMKLRDISTEQIKDRDELFVKIKEVCQQEKIDPNIVFVDDSELIQVRTPTRAS